MTDMPNYDDPIDHETVDTAHMSAPLADALTNPDIRYLNPDATLHFHYVSIDDPTSDAEADRLSLHILNNPEGEFVTIIEYHPANYDHFYGQIVGVDDFDSLLNDIVDGEFRGNPFQDGTDIVLDWELDTIRGDYVEEVKDFTDIERVVAASARIDH